MFSILQYILRSCTTNDTNSIYLSILSSSMRECGQTVKLGKLVFHTNLLRSIDITMGDV